jgi:hypothetical protein
MAWDTPASASSSDIVNTTLMNKIYNDLRKLGDNVDCQGYQHGNSGGVYDAAGNQITWTQAYCRTSYYNWSMTSAASVSVGASQVLTLAPVPPGVNSANPNYYVYIPDGANSELVPVTGGTAVENAPSGTLIVTCAHAHTGPVPVRSYSAGIQECFFHVIDAFLISVFHRTPLSVMIDCPQPTSSLTDIYGPIYVPPAQDWLITCHKNVLNFVSSGVSWDAVTIDTNQNCEYRLPIMVYAGTGNIVHVNPVSAAPIDGSVYVGMGVSELYITLAIGNGSTTNAAVYLDTSTGFISTNTLRFIELSSCKYGLLIDGSQNCEGNTIFCNSVHAMLLSQVCEKTTTSIRNVYTLGSVQSPGGSAVGIDIKGLRGIWTVGEIIGTASGLGIVWDAACGGNNVTCGRMDGGHTYNATLPNCLRIIDQGNAAALKLGYNTTTPAIPSTGNGVRNDSPYAVWFYFKSIGGGGTFQINDQSNTGQTTASTMVQGVWSRLEPGETAYLFYSSTAPTWQWRAIAR